MTSNENKFENIPMIQQPKELNVDLYIHQLASVYAMETRERERILTHNISTSIETNIGISADETGYGKTLAMATLLYRDKMPWDLTTPYIETTVSTHADGKIKITRAVDYEKNDTTLILVSQSIITQWYEEILKTPLAVKMIISRKDIEETCINNYDVIIVTPTMYNKIVVKYSRIAWKRFIFDEPGHMRVPGMKQIVAGFIWLVTATPFAVIAQHKNCRNSYMYNIIEHFKFYTDMDIFSSLLVKNTPEFIRQSFSMPKTKHIYYTCHNPLLKTIQGLVTPKINIMISAGNIQGAIKALGGGETRNITELVRKKKMDEIEILNTRLKIFTIRNKPKKIQLINEKIQRIQHQIHSLDKRYTDILSGDCNICMEKIKNPVLEPSCQNIFCGDCLLTWIKNKPSCPLCRQCIKTTSLVYIKNEQDDKKYEQPSPSLKTKINTVIELINNKPDGKFIIFSAWDQTFTPIRETLVAKKIKYIEIKGSTKSRVQNIKSFKEGDVNVVFLNSRFNGSGINLQESSDIIIYHQMNQSTLSQIIGRANRLGRTESLIVHHLQI